MNKGGKEAKGPGGAVAIPPSIVPGIAWPALPSGGDSLILALQHQFDRSEWYAPEVLLALQLGQLRNLCADAARSVPFYRDRLKPFLDAEKPTLKSWRQVPLLTKNDIQAAGDALLSRRYPESHGQVGDIWTTGSTGQPIRVKSTDITRLFLAALNLRYHRWHRRDFTATVAAILVGGLLAVDDQSGTEEKPKPWVPAYGTGRMFSKTVRSEIGAQLDWLVKVKPDYLTTYPTNLAALVERSRITGVVPEGLRQVSTQGEVLDEAVRAACRKVWGATVADVYSAQETGMIAAQCPEVMHFHIQAESALVEILDRRDEPCGPGESGRVVVTALHNFAMPLIRYDIGDWATVGPPCSCGRGLPVISNILGRSRNMLRLPSGDVTWPLFFSRGMGDVAPEIRQGQLVQTGPGDLVFRIVAPPLGAEKEARLREAVLKRLGFPFALSLEYVESISARPNGKFEDFVSLLA